MLRAQLIIGTLLLADARRLLEEAERLLEQEAYGPARINAVRAKNRAIFALRASEDRD